jgi:predicted DNA-binding transcriptional regulator YafY
MFMLKLLDESVLRLRDVTDRFEVSLRTVQRDLEVLLMAGYMIIDGPEPGTYTFPKGYKAHHAFEF